MRRRGLFAGLAGLLAAPKLPAAAPAVGSRAAEAVHRQVFTEWVVGEAAEFDFVAGGVVAPGETVTLNWHDAGAIKWAPPDGVEAIHPLPSNAAGSPN